jgi:uncharacterized damage-inducible protein DinB
MSHPPYTQLVAIKQWADRGLYDAVCRQFDQLSNEDATLMLRILDHVHTVDRIFQHHLQGLPHPFAAPRSEKLPELSTLAQQAQQVDDWYVSYAQTVTQAELDEPLEFTFTSGKPARASRRSPAARLPARHLPSGQRRCAPAAQGPGAKPGCNYGLS